MTPTALAADAPAFSMRSFSHNNLARYPVCEDAVELVQVDHCRDSILGSDHFLLIVSGPTPRGSKFPVYGDSGRMAKNVNDQHSPSTSEDVAGRCSVRRMEAQDRKEYKGEEEECPAELSLLLFPPLCPACLLSCSNAFASNRRQCALRGD
jgi:hypothetical protein